jgi:hypothetical protein
MQHWAADARALCRTQTYSIALFPDRKLNVL